MEKEMMVLLRFLVLALTLAVVEALLERASGFNFHPENYDLVTHLHELAMMVAGGILSRLFFEGSR